jgi:CHRD domain
MDQPSRKRTRRCLVKRLLMVLVLVPLALVGWVQTVSAADGGRPFATTLSGAAEVPGPGDPDGSGTATLTVNPGRGEICYTLTVAGIAPSTAAHIHVGPAGVAGPVVVPLGPPTDGTISACADVDRALALDIVQNPENYYVNVHNAEFPAGAVRGQL